MEKLTKCSICWGKFSEPKMLPCLHTFCLKCLRRQTVEREKLKCSLCRAEHNVPSNGVEGFFNNTTMMELLSITDTMPRLDCKPCKECKSGRDIQKSCEHCDRYLCNVCLQRHVEEVINSMDTDMKTVGNHISKLEEHVRTMDGREKVAKSVEREINQWKEKRINAVRSSAKILIDETYSHVQFDASSRCRARDMVEEIKKFQNHFIANIKPVKYKMSEVLKEKEKLKRLSEQGEKMASTLKDWPDYPTELRFDEEELTISEAKCFRNVDRSVGQRLSETDQVYHRKTMKRALRVGNIFAIPRNLKDNGN